MRAPLEKDMRSYLIHDWLFVAKNCVTDNAATATEQVVSDMTFIESAEVLGEAIKGLIEAKRVLANDIAPEAISRTVAGPISRRLWLQPDRCQAHRLKPEHKTKVDQYVRRFGAEVLESGINESLELDDTLAVALVRF